MTRDELIAALEAAPGPSRELFVEAYKIAHNLENWQGRDPLSFARFAELLDAEAWLDAAMTLVGEGMEWSISTLYGVALVDVGLNSDDPAQGSRQDGNVPLALCSAALKAGEAKDG